MLLNDTALNEIEVNGTSPNPYVRIKTGSDAATVYDANVKREYVRIGTTAATLIDNIIATVIPGGSGGTIYTQTSGDALIVTDGSFRTVLRGRTVIEVLTIPDASLRAVLRQAITAEGISVLDAVLRFAMRTGLVSDSATLTDGNVYFAVRGRVSTDTIALVDFISGVVITGGTIYVRTGGDAIVITDGTQRFLMRQRETVEVLTMSDASVRAVLRGATTSDGITVIDAIVGAAMRLRFVADTFALSDGTFHETDRNRIAADPITVTDQTLSSLLRQRYASDVLTVIDSLILQIVGSALYVKTATDAFSVTDELRYGRALGRFSQDGFDLSEATQKALRLTRVSPDLVQLVDELIKAIISSGTIYSATTTDTVRLLDELLHSTERDRTSADNLLVTEGTLRTLQRLSTLSDSITFSDGIATFRFLGRRLDEFLGITDGYLSTHLPAVFFDVHVVLGHDRGAYVSGYSPCSLSAELSQPLGGYTPFRIGARQSVVLGGYG